MIVAKDDDVQIEKLELGIFDANAYLIVCRATLDSVLVDAPAEARMLLDRLGGTNPKYILLTHAHRDHIGALTQVRAELQVPVALHYLEAEILQPPPEIMLSDGDVLSFGKVEVKVLHTPGHTPGSVCFLMGKHLIVGDTIFPGGPGVTVLPEDFKQIIESISQQVFTLPDDTQVYPGHGDSTVLVKERDDFLAFTSSPYDPDLCGHVLWRLL